MRSEYIEVEVGREEKFHGRILDMQVLTVRLPDGSTATREVVRHKGACAILAVNDKREAAMVTQYRCPMEKRLLEIPAGKLDSAGEDPAECARRELSEETGLIAENIREIAAFYPTVGYSDELIHLYLATGLTEGEAHPDEGEYLTFEWIALDKLMQMALAGQISDGKTLLAIMMADKVL